MKNRMYVARAEVRMSQEALAEKVGVSRVHINQVETGRATPSVSVAIRIGKALGKTVDELFYEED